MNNSKTSELANFSSERLQFKLINKPSLIGSTPIISRGGTIVSLNSTLMALAVSLGVGILAGIIPAYQASRLRPVDALRYE